MGPSTDPVQQRVLEAPKEREVECLLDELKKHFAAAGGQKSAAQRQAHREALLQSVGADARAAITNDMLDTAMGMQMVRGLAARVPCCTV